MESTDEGHTYKAKKVVHMCDGIKMHCKIAVVEGKYVKKYGTKKKWRRRVAALGSQQ